MKKLLILAGKDSTEIDDDYLLQIQKNLKKPIITEKKINPNNPHAGFSTTGIGKDLTSEIIIASNFTEDKSEDEKKAAKLLLGSNNDYNDISHLNACFYNEKVKQIQNRSKNDKNKLNINNFIISYD